MTTNPIFRGITTVYGAGLGIYSNYFMYLELKKSKKNTSKDVIKKMN